MEIIASLVHFKNSLNNNQSCALALPFFPRKRSYYLDATFDEKQAVGDDWISFPVKKGKLKEIIYLNVPNAARILEVEPQTIKDWQSRKKFFKEAEQKARFMALQEMPKEFLNPKIKAVLENSILPSEFRDEGLAGFLDKKGRIILADEKSKRCWDLFRREPAVNWRGKLLGRTIQILPGGRCFEHLKERKGSYASGSWKVCKFARDFLTKEQVARLVVKVNQKGDEGVIQRHLTNLWALQQLQGVRGIVERYGDVRARNKYGDSELVSYQRYYKLGSLYEFYLKNSTFKLIPAVCDKIAEDLLVALTEMHKRKIYHRDLKEENILLDLNRENPKFIDAAICDFDLCWVEGMPFSTPGTPCAMAPEYAAACKRNAAVPRAAMEKNDVWGMGLILYRLYHGNSLPGLRDMLNGTAQVLSQLAGQQGTIFFPTMAIDSLIWKMLQIDPKKRISAKEALEEFRVLMRQR